MDLRKKTSRGQSRNPASRMTAHRCQLINFLLPFYSIKPSLTQGVSQVQNINPHHLATRVCPGKNTIPRLTLITNQIFGKLLITDVCFSSTAIHPPPVCDIIVQKINTDLIQPLALSFSYILYVRHVTARQEFRFRIGGTLQQTPIGSDV